ncbi:hypothetical protein [Streptomyces sp. YS-3]|uniref:hypothetical protein n=1 Tax=Streptomyces sp. YS-3 TaxID=3381352 RepID=UPI0038628EB9
MRESRPATAPRRGTALWHCLRLGWIYLTHFELPALRALLSRRTRDVHAHEQLFCRLSHRLLTAGVEKAGFVLERHNAPPSIEPGRPVVLLVRHSGPFNPQLLALLACHELGRSLISVGRLLPALDPALALLLRPLRVALFRWNRHGPARAMRFLIHHAQRLGPDDVLAYFPEGAHMTAAGRRTALKALHTSDPERAAWARQLRYVLPPVTAGTARVLAQAVDADVVIVGHTGLEDPLGCLTDLGYPSTGDRRVHLNWWHTPAAAVPREPAAAAAWLDQRWAAMDAWIAHARTLPPPQSRPDPPVTAADRGGGPVPGADCADHPLRTPTTAPERPQR